MRIRKALAVAASLGTLIPLLVVTVSPAVSPAFSISTAPPGLFGWAHSTAEPSIGVNPETNATMFQMTLDTAKVTFDAAGSATWENVSYPVASIETLDPILWTDQRTGRTYVLQLMTAGSIAGFTDDDGQSWTPAVPVSVPAVDHESIGGGPYHQPAPPTAAYDTALYYCAQAVAEAQCARSDDGGRTWGVPVPIHANTCFAAHGHITVDPDGVVYVPFKNCGGGMQGMMRSFDNGLTWSVSRVKGTQAVTEVAARDPKIAVDAAGKLYFTASSKLGILDGTRPVVSTSTDHGDHWTTPVDVGTALGIKNAEFPMAVAGDSERAAFGFYGTPTGGDDQIASFAGRWHLYVAFTYDGGGTWETVDATPADPVYIGSMCLKGTTCPDADRRLADFMDMTIDNHGRVLVGYSDGCTSAACLSPTGTHAHSSDALGSIARQSAGRTLFGAYD